MAASARPILVGIGEGDSGPDAVALGELLSRATGGELVLACVYPADPGVSEEYRLARRGEAEERLDAALRGVTSSDVAMHGVVHAAPSPAGGLVELATGEDTELVVIGSRHTGPLAKLLSSAVTERLLGMSPCPVATAPRGFATRAPELFRRVGLGYDGSEQARAALAEASRLVEATGAQLRILVVCDTTPPPGLSESEREWFAGERRTEAEARLEEALGALDESLQATGTVVAGEPARATGAPALALEAAAASDALDLLVIGSHGWGPFHATVAGSVSSYLARHAACPLVIVPAPAATAAEDAEVHQPTST